MVIIHDIEISLSVPPEVLSIVGHFHAPFTLDLANVAPKSLLFRSFEIYH